MPRALIFRKIVAAVTMALATLCGGVKAHAEQDGTLSIVELQTGTPLRPDQRQKTAEYLRLWLGTQGFEAVVSVTKSEKLSVWSRDDHGPVMRKGVPGSASFGIHRVERVLGSDEDADSLKPGLRAMPYAEATQTLVIHETPFITDDGIKWADAVISEFDNRPTVQFVFTEAAALVFGEVSEKSVGDQFAIVVDNTVLSAPVIREPIYGGRGQISGDFTMEGAQNIVVRMLAPPSGVDFVVLKTCTAAKPRGPPLWGPKLIAEPACE